METTMQSLRRYVVTGDRTAVEEAVRQLVGAKADPERVLRDGLIAAMTEVGSLFERGELFVPEMLASARAMQAGLALVKPLLVTQGIEATGKIVIGTVKGDLHDIGKNLVGMMLEGAGFEVFDLGTDVPPERFGHAAQEHGATVIAMSAMLTTTMENMRSTMGAIAEAGVRGKVKVMIGGAPVTDAFAEEIGADGYAADASRAVALARSLFGSS